jgi:hypothetical protein
MEVGLVSNRALWAPFITIRSYNITVNNTTQLSVQCVPEALFSAAKRPGRAAPANAVVKNFSYLSTEDTKALSSIS